MNTPIDLVSPNGRAATAPHSYPADGNICVVNLWRPQKQAALLDPDFGRRVLVRACLAAGATILDEVFTNFGEGAGFTGALVLAQSHCTIHTYPERHFIAVDFYTCGPLDTHRAVTQVVRRFAPGEYHVIALPRSAAPPSHSRG